MGQNVKQVRISELEQDRANANKGSERGTYMLESSLRQFGAGRSILIDKHGRIIAGNKSAEQAAAIGIDDVIVVESDGTKLIAVQRTDLDLYEDEAARKLAYADNRTSDFMTWDADQILADLNAGVNLDQFWRKDELDELLADLQPKATGDTPAEVDRAEELRQKWGVKPGDLWELGSHRLICGDCTDAATVARVMGGERADCTVTDPPYGVGVEYSDFDDTHENVKRLFDGFMPIALQMKPVALTPGIPMMWDYPRPDWLMSWIHPASTSSGPWGFIGTNPILVYGDDPYLKQGKGRRHTHIVMAADRQGEKEHPVTKPLNVWEWLIERMTPTAGAIVYEPFSGSGTTIIACENLGRKCRGVELSPSYVGVTLERFFVHTGRQPVLVDI